MIGTVSRLACSRRTRPSLPAEFSSATPGIVIPFGLPRRRSSGLGTPAEFLTSLWRGSCSRSLARLTTMGEESVSKRSKKSGWLMRILHGRSGSAYGVNDLDVDDIYSLEPRMTKLLRMPLPQSNCHHRGYPFCLSANLSTPYVGLCFHGL